MTTTKRLPFFDSIRGLAAVSVIASHFVLAYGLPPSWLFLKDTPVRILWHGDGAVVLFFILSGLVLSLSHPSPFFSYTLKRCLRILPLLFAVITLSIAAQHTLFSTYTTIPAQSGWIQWFWKQPFSLKSIALLLPQAWTLGIELPASICIPLARRRTQSQLLFVMIIMMSGFVVSRYNIFIYLWDFLIGIFLATYAKPLQKMWRHWNSTTQICYLVLGILLYTQSDALIISIGCSMILITVMNSIVIEHFLSRSVFVFFGKHSYSMYLTHFIVLLCFTPWFIHFINTLGMNDPYLVRLLGLASTIIVTMLISLITFYTIEQPFITFGKKIM